MNEVHQILIVDDFQSNLTLLEKILKPANLAVFSACSGQEALRLAAEREFAMALIDIVMPGMDGLETARRLKQTPLNKDLPVVFLSAFMNEQADIVKGFEFGAFDYIVKPYDAVLLLNKINIFCSLFEQKKLLKKQNEELVDKNKALEQAIAESSRARKALLENEQELQKHQLQLQELVDQRTAELIKAKQQAEEATQAKSEFLGNISHELRTPMHQILGYAKMGIDHIMEESREKLLNYFQEVYSSSQRMYVLQNNLMDLSKLESNEIIFALQNESVSEIVEEVLIEYQKRAVDQNIELNFTPDTSIEKINLDKDKFKQVLRNLINNAFDFSDQGGQITIKISDQSAKIVLSIIDSGVGIPQNELISVFDKFGKSSNPRSLTSGAGLGLFISSMIITGHKGKIWAENNPEGGAIITIELPRNQKQPKKLIGQILVEKGYLTKEQLELELRNQRQHS